MSAAEPSAPQQAENTRPQAMPHIESPTLNQVGYTVAGGLLDAREVSTVLQALEDLALDKAGTRNLLDLAGAAISRRRSSATGRSSRISQRRPSQFNARFSIRRNNETGLWRFIRT
jgi:hypothetical protein